MSASLYMNPPVVTTVCNYYRIRVSSQVSKQRTQNKKMILCNDLNNDKWLQFTHAFDAIISIVFSDD